MRHLPRETFALSQKPDYRAKLITWATCTCQREFPLSFGILPNDYVRCPSCQREWRAVELKP